MSPADPSDATRRLEELRARTLAELEHQLERRHIDRPEFEQRSARAVDARSPIELRPLVADLLERHGETTRPVPARTDERSFEETVGAPATTLDGARGGDDHEWAVAIMSGSSRTGQWEPPEHVTALAIMGGIRLDFREAALLEGVVTEVSVFCLMGGAEVIVPPDIHVSVSGTGLLGGFGHVSQTALESDAPRLHVSGLALMGGVEIKVREPGEDVGDGDSP